jgi:uncharacterized protein
MAEAWKRIWTFVVLVLMFSFGAECLILLVTRKVGGAWGYYVQAVMWMPALAAFATCRLRRKPLSELGFGWPRRKYILVAWLLPLAYCLVAYVPVWFSPWGGFYNHDFVSRMSKDFGLAQLPTALQIGIYVLFAGTLGVIRSTNALGEEIGWRGFLVPELAKVTSFGGVVAFTTVLWVLYHVPALLFADYNVGTPWWYGLLCFSLLCLSGCVSFAWLRLRSGSVWPAAILHASHNLFVQNVFDPLTVNSARTPWLTSEFGIAVPVAMCLAALWFWSRRREVEGPAKGLA